MTKEMFQAVFSGYDARLANQFGVEPKAFTDELYDTKGAIDDPVVAAHLRWMCQRVLNDFLPSFLSCTDALRKVATWLGYIQGELRALGLFSVSEMRAHNREGRVPLGGSAT